MRSRKSLPANLVLMMILGLVLSACQTAPASQPIPGSCTTFAVQQDGVFLGNNEDYSNPATYLWTEPSTATAYGGVYVGYTQGKPQGGINEMGLAFDGLALEPEPLKVDPDKPMAGISTAFMARVLRSCANVDEAAEVITGHNWGQQAYHQFLIADASGDAAIISAGTDGELVVTRKPAGEGHLVATNFNAVRLTDPDYVIPCERYATADAGLARLLDKRKITVDTLFGVLDDVHQQGAINNTLYSNVFDLENGIVYLAYWYQFDEIITLNVEEEIAAAPYRKRIRSLFSERTVEQAEQAFQRLYTMPTTVNRVVLIWLMIAVVCGCLIAMDMIRQPGSPWYIVIIGILMGLSLSVIGLLVYVLTWRPVLKRTRTVPMAFRAMASASLSSTGITFAVVLIFLFTTLFFSELNLGIFALLVPYAVSLLLFRAPVKAYLYGLRYGSGLLKSLLPELLSTLVGVIAILILDQQLNAWLNTYNVDAQMLSKPVYWGRFAVFGIAILVILYLLHLLLIALKVKSWPERR